MREEEPQDVDPRDTGDRLEEALAAMDDVEDAVADTQDETAIAAVERLRRLLVEALAASREG